MVWNFFNLANYKACPLKLSPSCLSRACITGWMGIGWGKVALALHRRHSQPFPTHLSCNCIELRDGVEVSVLCEPRSRALSRVSCSVRTGTVRSAESCCDWKLGPGEGMTSLANAGEVEDIQDCSFSELGQTKGHITSTLLTVPCRP